MTNYEYEEDLTYLPPDKKLAIVKKEIEKIISINTLLFNALKYNQDNEYSDSYIIASQLIDKASLNIIKMFPY